jgi:hypothetical protein
MQGRNQNRTKNIARAALVGPQNRKKTERKKKEGFKTQLPPPPDAAPAEHHNISTRMPQGFIHSTELTL